jgi:PleD family two-component response regulator
MGKARLLVVEDDNDISNMLKIYFTGLGYDVDVAPRGVEALEKTRTVLPHLIVLDIMLPDIDGYEVCRRLRQSTRSSHIPVIFLTQKDERSDKLQGLELGADDYITKPFDIEELKLRVQGAIRRSEREALTDPRSGLPAGRLIEDQLRFTIRQTDWAYMDIRINHFDQFKDLHGPVKADAILRSTALMIGKVVDELGNVADFIGHAGGDNFVIITSQAAAVKIHDRLKSRFAEEAQSQYKIVDRQQGDPLEPTDGRREDQAALMSLSIGIVKHEQQSFADIREITELAAESRRQDASDVRKG